jgi:hypothetical protein
LPYFGQLYKDKSARGNKANTAILATARRMARITWQLLTEGQTYTNFPVNQKLRSHGRDPGSLSQSRFAKEGGNGSKPKKGRSPVKTFPSRSNCTLAGR